MAARSAILKYLRVQPRSISQYTTNNSVSVSTAFNNLLGRHFSDEARGSFLDISEVTDRVLSAVKNFQKVDSSKKGNHHIQRSNTMNWKTINKPCKKLLISSGGASSGRNSAGRITIWHRGGGSKRLHRNVDLKRNTSSVGIVERIEYDPNRSSKIALVRWTEGVQPIKPREHFTPSQKLVPGPITTTVTGNFPLSCMASNNARTNNEFVGSRVGSLKDVFISAFASPGSNNFSLLNIPRIAVAGARPAFFAQQMRGETEAGEEKTFAPADIRKWKKDSVLWAHRSKRKAAVSWQGIGGHDMTLGFVKAYEDETMVDQGRLLVQPVDQVTKTKDQRAPISYILASHELEVGQMVMNCDSSKPSRTQRAF